MKAVYDNRERLVRAHSAGRETVRPMSVAIPSLPLHPGAVRYYREIGVALPAVLVTAD